MSLHIFFLHTKRAPKTPPEVKTMGNALHATKLLCEAATAGPPACGTHHADYAENKKKKKKNSSLVRLSSLWVPI